MSTMALGMTQPPIQRILGPLLPGIKWLKHEADHSSPSTAKTKKKWSCTFTPCICLHGMHWDNPTFYFYLGGKGKILHHALPV
jgi:hypothetical protein